MCTPLHPPAYGPVALSSLSPVIDSVEVESRSQTPSLQLRCRHRRGLDSVRTMLTIFYHTNHYAITGHVVKCSLCN